MSIAVEQHRILNSPLFSQLVAQRGRLSAALSLLVISTYFGFVAVVAFRPAWLHTPLSADNPMSIGWPIGAGLIVGAWLLTGLYVRQANRVFDRLNERLLQEEK